MKMKALAHVALMLFAGAAIAQDAGPSPSTQSQALPGQQSPQSQSDQRAQQGQQRPSTSSSTAASGAANSFASADSDKDGKLSVSELQRVMPSVTITDADGDGYVSQAEAEAGIAGLAFEGGSGSDDIGEEEYGQIVALMGQSGGAAGAGAAGAGSERRTGTGN